MFGFYIFLGFEKLLMLLPHSWRKALFLGLAKLAFHIDKKHRRIIRQNMQFVYGDGVDEKFVEEVSRYGYQSLTMNFLFAIESRHMSLDAFKEKVSFENAEYVEKAQAEGRPIVFVTSHFGEWEVSGNGTSAFVEPLMVVYKKMSNPYFEQYALKSRAKDRMTFAERRGALKALIRRMRQNKAAAILIDTNINEREGVVVDFLGKPTRQVSTPAYLGRKFNAAIIPGVVYTDDHEHYTVKFFPEIEVEKTDDEKADIKEATKKSSDWLSGVIYDDPKYWFWMHRRWKTDYPEIYTKK
ncbi:MAG: lipid A biosynthesis lauroyl acyltransferase [Thiovulaceae bacterium]|nr:lipid A biosynthesis lauroyl acyltransferase [Sulfurimonadaceae bacterium]